MIGLILFRHFIPFCYLLLRDPPLKDAIFPSAGLLRETISCGTRAEVELFLITLELSEVVTCWASLDDYFDKLIVKDFMEPEAYAKLLSR